MKSVIGIILLLSLFSCKKYSAQPVLELSKTVVKKGELVTASVLNAAPNTRFYWTLPGYVNQLGADSSKASSWFRYAGDHEITVSLYHQRDSIPYAWYTKTITVINENFPLPGNITHPFNGEQVTMRPFFLRDSTLSFILTTLSANYSLNSYIVAANQSVGGERIKFSLNGIWQDPKTKADKVPVKSILATGGYYPDGIYPVEVSFDNIPYHGMLKVSNDEANYTFTWLHTSGVLIEPKELNRHKL